MTPEVPTPIPTMSPAQEAETKRRALNPWVTVVGKIGRMTNLFPVAHSFFKKHRRELKAYYELVYKEAAGETLSDDAAYRLARFELAASTQPRLAGLQAQVRETVYRTPDELTHRISHGTKIHRRRERTREKAAAETAEMNRLNAPYIAAREEEARKRTQAARLATRTTRYTSNWWERD
jgi:hypothetical protein